MWSGRQILSLTSVSRRDFQSYETNDTRSYYCLTDTGNSIFISKTIGFLFLTVFSILVSTGVVHRNVSHHYSLLFLEFGFLCRSPLGL